MAASRCGVWIDNAEAIVIRFAHDGTAKLERMESGVAPRAKTKGGMRGTGGHIRGASHKKPEQRRLNQLARFHDDVYERIRDAEAIAILGPGVAKTRLEAEVQGHHRHPEIVAVQPLERQTDRQLIARFRELLGVPRPD